MARIRTIHIPGIVLSALSLFLYVSVFASAQAALLQSSGLRASLHFESRAAVRRGLAYLQRRQLSNGSWANHPVVTAMALLAFADSIDANTANDAQPRQTIESGVEYLIGLQQQQDDGAIVNRAAIQYPVYSTAVATLALARVKPQTCPNVLLRARKYLVLSQHNMAENSPDFGGFPGVFGGYPELITSQWVLEALYLTDHLTTTEKTAVYDRALIFIRRCQNPGDPEAGGGMFLDSPRQTDDAGKSMVSPATPTNSYMRTAAGVKCLIYGRVGINDHQLREGIEWLYSHLADSFKFLQSIEPCIYTSFFFIGRAMSAVEMVERNDRFPDLPNWRNQIAIELLNRQRGDGAWRPGEQAWWENNPDLVSAYAVLTLNGFLRLGGQ